jgi:hypothetical protein
MAGRAYDPAARRRGVRRGRERGCWLYVPAEEVSKALGEVPDTPPFYRVWGLKGATVMVKLYRDP